MSETPNKLSTALKALRKSARNPSLRTIAERAGISHTAVDTILAGHNIPRWSTACNIITAMGGNPDDYQELWEEVSQRPVTMRENREPAMTAREMLALILSEIRGRPSEEVISQIRNAYEEAREEQKIDPRFLFGMRYVMRFLDMPEGIGPDGAGLRTNVERATGTHYVSTYCIHGNHDACRLMCKTCGAPCQCDDPECTHE